MVFFQVAEAAAGQAVGTDLLASGATARFKFDGRARMIRRIGVTGSNNAGSGSVAVYYGNTLIGIFAPTTSGANVYPLDAKDMMVLPTNLVLAPNEPLIIQTNAVSTTNAMVVAVEIVEL